MSHSDSTDPGRPPLEAGTTQRLPVGPPDDPGVTQSLDLAHLQTSAQSTQKLELPRGGAEPLQRRQRSDAPAQTAGQTLKSPTRSRSRIPGWLWPAALVSLAGLGAAGYVLIPGGSGPGPVPPPDSRPMASSIPSGDLVYLEQAKAGDAHAMRMLGVMYYYGLNVPQDREKGLHWYRQAAAKGSEAARAELVKLEKRP